MAMMEEEQARMEKDLDLGDERSAEDPVAVTKEVKDVPRCTVRTPQIHWHGKSPVFAIDFHPHFTRLCVTGGLEPDGTGGIHLWIVNDSTAENAEKAPVSFVQDLQGHEKSVNCLRFCPKGDLLASAGVEGSVIIWRRTSVAPSPAAAIAGHEKWEYMTMLRAHTLDAVDLSWSPSCTQLATASVDNTSVVLNIAPNKEKVAANIRGHDHFTLGVAWDPKNEFIVTTSSDGSTRFNTSKSRKWKADARPAHTTCKMEFPDKKNAKPAGFADGETNKVSREFKMFLDDSMAGLYQKSAASTPFYVSHVLARRNPTKSFALLPSGRKPSVAVRFCPTLFKLSKHAGREKAADGVPTPAKLFATPQKAALEQEPQSGFNLPYRMVFAVATSNSILLYDTEQMKAPVMYVSGIHFDSITDLAWSKDGQFLIATSKDGYCSMIEFAAGELGEPLEQEFLPPVVAKNMLPGKSIDLSIIDPDDEIAAAGNVQNEETAIQKLAEMVAAPAALPEPVIEWKEGDKVQARWKGGTWFTGTIKKVNEPEVQDSKDDKESEEAKTGDEAVSWEMIASEPVIPPKTYAVQFDDGDFDDCVPEDHIQAWEDRRARKRRIVPQVVKSVEELTKAPDAATQDSAASKSTEKALEAEATTAAVGESQKSMAMEDSTGQSEPEASQTQKYEFEAQAAVPEAQAAMPQLEDPQQVVQDAVPKKRRIIPTTIVSAI